MGGWSARKALKVMDNVEISTMIFLRISSSFIVAFSVLAIELLMACQAIDLLHPLTTTAPLQAVHDFIRQSIP